MTRLPKVVSVAPLPDFKLRLEFEEGETRLFDVTPYIRSGTVFEPLSNSDFFNTVQVAFGTVVWPDGIDLAPETLFRKSSPLS